MIEREATVSRPAQICAYLLLALEGSEGRRRRRKRNTAPDQVGLGIKRALLEAAVRDDPDPVSFEAWLLEQCLQAEDACGPTRAMAREILLEYHIALHSPEFASWLAEGAPSDDARRNESSADR